MKRITTFIVILLLLVSIISCELFNSTKADVDIYGLFVGLDYKNSAVNDLNGTINDAKEMAAAFYTLANAYGIDFEGYLALQEETSRDYDHLLYPSRENLLARIEGIGEMMDEDDIFIFYYAGHGAEEGDISSPYHGALTTAPENSGQNYTDFTTDDVTSALRSLPGIKVILLDSCFSGAHVEPYPRINSIDSPNYDPTQFYLTAAMEDQESWEGNEYLGHGYFTFSLLNYLGWNQTGNTIMEMYRDDSIEMKESVTVTGTFSDVSLSNLPPFISLEDVASSIKKARIGGVYQEKKMTSGPTNVLLFHKDWGN